MGKSYDVLGDGSLTMVNIPGHSEGLCALKIKNAEGIIDDDVDRSIRNLTVIGADAMCATDSMVLDIMTGKS